jgi:carbonic anhydrase
MVRAPDAIHAPVVHTLLAANARQRGRVPAPAQTPRPELALAIVTCMDARLDLFDALGLDLGQAHIIRNAGGRVTADVIRSVALSAHLGVREVGIMHHTGCGLEGASNADLRRQTGLAIDFLPFRDASASVQADVGTLRKSRALRPGSIVWGALYETAAASVTLVQAPRHI